MKIFLSETNNTVSASQFKKTIELLTSPPDNPVPGEQIIEYRSPGQLKKSFRTFEKDELQMKLVFWSRTGYDRLKTNFFHLFTNIDAAGGLVRNEKGERLFIFRLGKWDLPKGKLSGKETAGEAAIREVKEETGLQELKIIGPLSSTYHIYSRKGKQILKQTYWFEMKAKSAYPLIPQKEEDITEVKWINRENLSTVLENTYGSIKEIVTRKS